MNKIIDEIKLSSGSIIVQKNESGGLSYISDKIGGGIVVWNTDIIEITELLFCLNHYSMYCRRQYFDKQEKGG